jgi:DNA-binding NarL/FixJ family response regulator
MFRRSSPKTRVIVLTGQSAGPALLDALAHGAHGVLNRRLLRALLVKAIRRVADGESWVPRKMIPKVMESLQSLPTASPSRRSRDPELSP